MGSSSSSSSSAHTTSTSTTSGWSRKGFQGAQTFPNIEGDISPYFARDSSATAECASRTFVPNLKLKGKTTAGPRRNWASLWSDADGRLIKLLDQMLDPWGILTIINLNPRGKTRDHLPDEDQCKQTGRDSYPIYSVLIFAIILVENVCSYNFC